MTDDATQFQWLVQQMQDKAYPAHRKNFDTDQVVLQPDDAALDFFVIESGEIHLHHLAAGGATRLLDILGPGEWLGSASLAMAPTYGKRAVAAAPSVVWAMPAELLATQLLQHGDLALYIVQTMARRLQRAWCDSEELVSDDCRHRLLKALLRFSTSPAAHRAGDNVVLHITHAQLAQAVGAARETISLRLNELRLQNMVRTGRNQLEFNPEHLRELSKSLT